MNSPSVFVVKSSEFKYFWRIFKRQMREVPGGRLKFAHNYEVHDNSLETSYGYWIKAGLDRTRPDVQRHRMNGLLQSGIFGLWVKWENIRSEVKRRLEEKEKDDDQDFKENENSSSYTPLSLMDPSIYLIVYFSASIYFLSGVLLTFELVSVRLKINCIGKMWTIIKSSSVSWTLKHYSKIRSFLCTKCDVDFFMSIRRQFGQK